MSTIAPTRAGRNAHVTPYRTSFAHTVRAEWIKMRSIRSTWWTLGATVLLMVLISLLGAGQATTAARNPEMSMSVSGLDVLTFSFIFVQLSVSVLGALTVTGEYATGMIRSTLSATPTRIPALLAKALVLVLVTASTVIIGFALSYLVTMPILSADKLTADLGDPATLRVLGLYILCICLIALLALGVGAMIRHSAGAIFTLVALLFVIPLIAQMISAEWFSDLVRFLPSNAASYAVALTNPSVPGPLTIATGTLTVVVWAAAALIGGGVLLQRRDA